MRVTVSIVYSALVQPTEAALADESENVKWFRADRLGELAFDHNAIIDYAWLAAAQQDGLRYRSPTCW